MQKIGREAVLNVLRERAPRTIHLMEVVAALGVPKKARDDVRDVLEALRGLGLAQEMPGQRFRLGQKPRRAAPAPPEVSQLPARGGGGDDVVGWLSRSRRGFAFVTAEDGGPDVFIPPTALGVAMHGDRVRVAARASAKGREGAVVEVVRRGVSRIAGTLRRHGKRAWLEPGDPRLPERVDVVGTIPLGLHPGDEVVAIVERWPSTEGEAIEARVLAALGVKGSAAVEIEKIKIREGIEEELDPSAVAEAQSFGTRVRESDLAGREDLRGLDLCTIDPPDARDHDDAVWAERTPDGFRVVVAIADVSHYVRAGSALDRAALGRATSIYMPDRVIPMLPHELSSNLASLVPDEDRLTLAVEAHVGPQGAIRKYRFLEGVMRSRARLSYEGVARALHFSESAPPQHEAEARRELLQVLWEVSQTLRQRRVRRGSIDFDLPEAKIVLGEDGEPTDIVRSRRDPGVRRAYAMIEDLMLLANEVVAEDLARRAIPAIYRVHGRPDTERVAQFAELASSLGYALDEDAAEHPKKLAAFLKRIDGTDHAQALSFLLLRSMQQATYDVNNIGHFALAARHYLHFTSPIRRYPDLAVHRVVRDLIRGAQVDRDALRKTLQEQARESSRLERRAMQIDRECADLYRAILMKDRVGEHFDATITGVAEHGLYITFEEPFVEARCPIDALGDDWFELDALGLRLVGKRTGLGFALGDRITVRVANVSVERREIQCVPEAKLPDDRTLLAPSRRSSRTDDRAQRALHRKKRRSEKDERRVARKQATKKTRRKR